MRLLRGLLQLSLFCAAAFASDTQDADYEQNYHENLLLKTLPGNSVLASFRFVTNGTFDNHHGIFPRSLAQTLDHSNTKELHLRFTLGRWDAERWGAQIWNGRTAGGTGVELWAWVEAEDDVSADKRWTTLNNALSGLFCASLNFIDSTRTVRPILSFEPEGDHASMDNLHLLHGTLPREPVCTENLTPFLKLLPCKGKAGISSLLGGHKLFDASWQSMSIDVRPVCDRSPSLENAQCQLQVIQHVEMVLDVERSLQRRDSPVPKPRPVEELSCDPNRSYYDDSRDSCFPQIDVSELSWSLSEIFGRRIRGYCPLGVGPGREPEHVCAEVPTQRPIFLSQGAKENKYPDGTRCFVLPEGKDAEFDLLLPEQSPPVSTASAPPPLYASRSFTGHGQERGGVQAVLTNPSLSESVEFIYLESLPWFMKPYLHTFSASLLPSSPHNDTKLVQSLYYRAALDRHRGTHLEAAILIPPNSTILLTYDFEKAILRYTEYPPDANRGFDIAPAHITITSPRHKGFAIRTTSLLLSLPTPDFSMPYNVIILTSTVMALAFGSVFNLLVRRFVGADEDIGGRLQKVRAGIVKLKTSIGRIVRKGRDKTTKTE